MTPKIVVAAPTFGDIASKINRRQKKKGGYTYHWLYRFTLNNGRRRSIYGGSHLPNNKKRIQQYRRNSRRYARRMKHEQTETGG